MRSLIKLSYMTFTSKMFYDLKIRSYDCLLRLLSMFYYNVFKLSHMRAPNKNNIAITFPLLPTVAEIANTILVLFSAVVNICFINFCMLVNYCYWQQNCSLNYDERIIIIMEKYISKKMLVKKWRLDFSLDRVSDS